MLVRIRLAGISGILVLGAALVVPHAVADTASTSTAQSFAVYGTGGEGLYLHPNSPTKGSQTTDVMPDGTSFAVTCWSSGDDVSGDAVWDFGTNFSTGRTGYAADFYINTPVTRGQEGAQLTARGIPECGHESVAAPTPTPASFYDRSAAVNWAVSNYEHRELISNDGDCTWFVSQALWAGGIPQTADFTAYSPDHGIFGNDAEAMARALVNAGYSPTTPINPTLDATNANDFVNYLVTAGLATKTLIKWSDNTAGGAEKGDLIAYDWDHGSDGTIDHVAIVTGFAPGTDYPTVTQHSKARLNRYWSWSPDDDAWIEKADRYKAMGNNGPPQAWLVKVVY